MNNNYEIVQYPKIRHIKIFLDEISYRTQHLHGDYEFCFCLKGEAKFILLNSEIHLNEGEIIFIDSHETHSIASLKDPFIGLFIQVSDRFLSDYLPELSTRRYKNINLKDCMKSDHIHALFQEANSISLRYFNEEENYRICTIAFVSNALNDVFTRAPKQIISGKENDQRKRNAERLQRMINYIDARISERITQKEVAELEDITTTYLSHIFTQGLGISFQDYINERRLELAIRLMRNSSIPLTEICYEAGFSDPKYMSKEFRKHFGCTPKQFKKQNVLYPISAQKKSGAIMERIYDEEESIRFLESS